MASVENREVSRDEAGMRLDRWFKTHFPGLGFVQLQKLLRSGQVRVDGSRAKTDTRLAAGQSVRVPPMAAGEAAARKPVAAGGAKGGDREALAAMTLYEDDAVLVLNKPAGLAVQGGSGLTRHVDGMLEALTGRDGQKPRLVHRLDRDTSGVLLIAKTRKAAQALAKSFRARETRKIYWALVQGVPKPRQGRISTYLAREEEAERMRVAHHGDEGASHAVSLYSVVDQVGQTLAWISLRPVTGRTHQLRAHCAHIRHPIIGDPKYFNTENWELPGGIQNKLHLHARRLIIPHPSGGSIDVTAPLSPHMQQSWNLLGFDTSAYDPREDERD